MPRMRKAQNTKKCAAPGTVHLSSFFWPKTSTTWRLHGRADPAGDALDAVGGRLAAADHAVEESTRLAASGSAIAVISRPTKSTREHLSLHICWAGGQHAPSGAQADYGEPPAVGSLPGVTNATYG